MHGNAVAAAALLQPLQRQILGYDVHNSNDMQAVSPVSDGVAASCPAVYELTGIGRNGELKNFEKPWAMTCIMFLGALPCYSSSKWSFLDSVIAAQWFGADGCSRAGMSLCLPLAYYQQSQAGKAKRARTDAEQPLMNGGEVSSAGRCVLPGFMLHDGPCACQCATLVSVKSSRHGCSTC